MALINSADELVKYLRSCEEIGVLNTPHGPTAVVTPHEIDPLIKAVEEDLACETKALEEAKTHKPAHGHHAPPDIVTPKIVVAAKGGVAK